MPGGRETIPAFAIRDEPSHIGLDGNLVVFSIAFILHICLFNSQFVSLLCNIIK